MQLINYCIFNTLNTYLQKLRGLATNNNRIRQMSYSLFYVTTWNKRFTGLNFLQEESITK